MFVWIKFLLFKIVPYSKFIIVYILTQRDEHKEEDDGPENRPSHCRYSLRIHYEHQAGTCDSNVRCGSTTVVADSQM